MAATIFDADQEAVLADEAPCLLIEAPPGSGKTYTAVRLIARDIEAGRIGPTQRALVLTFSRNARAQLDSYAAEILTAEQRRLTEITNYHSWFWAKLSQFQMSLGLPAELEIASEARRIEEVRSAMAAEGVKVVERGKGRNLADYRNAPEYELAPGRPERLTEPLPKGVEVAARLLERQRASGILHYDDLAYYMWSLLDGSHTLRELWRHKYPVIVLDEYQDTSPLQAAIVARWPEAGIGSTPSPTHCSRSTPGGMPRRNGWRSSVSASPPNTASAPFIDIATAPPFKRGCSRPAMSS